MQEYNEFQIKLTLKFRIPKEGITINSVLYTVTKSLSEVGKTLQKMLMK